MVSTESSAADEGEHCKTPKIWRFPNLEGKLFSNFFGDERLFFPEIMEKKITVVKPLSKKTLLTGPRLTAARRRSGPLAVAASVCVPIEIECAVLVDV